jgi:hypothetical protein
MQIKAQWRWSLAVVGVLVLLAACAAQMSPHGADPALRIGWQDIGGVVTSSKGAEAGVWVIAETTDLPTKFTKIVVTDERGRYVMPELPQANYRVWVRGYGLVDSTKVPSVPGRKLDLKAVIAPSAAAAAEYYPPIYWYSMLKIPAKNEFPAGRGAQYRAEPVGLEHAHRLHARPDFHRPAPTHGQRLRQALRRARREHQFPAHP